MPLQSRLYPFSPPPLARHQQSHDCSLRSQAPQGRPRRWSDCKQSENAAHTTKTNKRSGGRKEDREREGREGLGGLAPEVVAGNGSARRCTRTRQACSSVKWVRQAAASSQVPAGSLCNCNGASASSLEGTRTEGARLMLAVLLLQQLKASSMLEMQSKCKTTANYFESE